MGGLSDKRSDSPADTDITAAYPLGDGAERGETSTIAETGGVKQDAVFGDINGESGPDFRSVSLRILAQGVHVLMLRLAGSCRASS